MNPRRRARNTLDPAEELRLEGLLNSAIKPVEPSHHFVRSLEERLTFDVGSDEFSPNRSVFSYFVLATTVVLAVSMVTVAALRMLAAILGVLGLAQQLRTEAQKHESPDHRKPA